MNDDLVSSIYDQIDEMPSFKGLHVCAIDSSIIENTKYEINIEMILEYLKKTQTLQRDTSTARILMHGVRCSLRLHNILKFNIKKCK